jgi:hypothetical protein
MLGISHLYRSPFMRARERSTQALAMRKRNPAAFAGAYTPLRAPRRRLGTGAAG